MDRGAGEDSSEGQINPRAAGEGATEIERSGVNEADERGAGTAEGRTAEGRTADVVERLTGVDGV